MNPDISVIIPVYNCQFYIEECLESIHAAIEYCKKKKESVPEPQVEVLVIDDGSSDLTGTMSDHFTERMQELTVYHTENQGVSAARKLGIQKARGNWILFIDGDDWIEKDYIQTLYETALNGKSDVICCNSIDTEEGKFRNNKILEEEEIGMLNRLLEDYFAGKRYLYVLWGKMIRRSLVQSLDFVKIAHTEDTHMMLQLLFQGATFHLLTYYGYHYRINPSGAMAVQNRSVIYKDRLVTLEYLWTRCMEKARFYIPDVNDQIVETLDVYISTLLDRDNPETTSNIRPLLREYKCNIHGPYHKKNKHKKKLLIMSYFPKITICCITGMYRLRRWFYKHN